MYCKIRGTVLQEWNIFLFNLLYFLLFVYLLLFILVFLLILLCSDVLVDIKVQFELFHVTSYRDI